METGRTVGIIWLLTFMAIPLAALPGCNAFHRSPPEEERARKEYDAQLLFERSGGLAGIRATARVDSRSLSPKEAQQLRDLLDQAGFLGLREEIAGAPKPDEFSYLITVDIDGQIHTVRTTDTAAPPQLKPLIDWLNKRARSGKEAYPAP
ncbi:MAG: hypothetical protein HY282_09510 [Nitrospirae bacterium]|nr:hypothetical protein [Candidatus Manganitrophaceae bacterium]